jgi:hypothetical protein
MSEKNTRLTRRDFIRGTVGTTLAATVFGIPWNALGAGQSSTVTIVRDQNALDVRMRVNISVLQKMLDQTLMQVTGKNSVKDAWRSLFNKDDVVGLVPTPHLNPTHDDVIDVVKAGLIKEVGISDDDIIMAQGSKRYPAKCTALISLPGLKAHWLTGIGTVIKNYIMFSGRPSLYHDEDSAKLGEIWLLPEVKGKTRLTIVDALHPLCDKGPQPDPRYKWAYNGLIAGTDPVAVETVCLNVITAKRKALKGEDWPLSPPPICIEAADHVYHLGTSNMNQIKIQKLGWMQEALV